MLDSGSSIARYCGAPVPLPVIYSGTSNVMVEHSSLTATGKLFTARVNPVFTGELVLSLVHITWLEWLLPQSLSAKELIA